MQISTPRRSRDKDAAHQGYTVNAVTCRNGEEPDRRGARALVAAVTRPHSAQARPGAAIRPGLRWRPRYARSCPPRHVCTLPRYARSCLHTAAIRAVMSAHCLGESRIGANENTHSQATANAGTSAARQTARPRSASCLQVSAAPRTRPSSCTCSKRARLRQRVALGDPES